MAARIVRLAIICILLIKTTTAQFPNNFLSLLNIFPTFPSSSFPSQNFQLPQYYTQPSSDIPISPSIINLTPTYNYFPAQYPTGQQTSPHTNYQLPTAVSNNNYMASISRPINIPPPTTSSSSSLATTNPDNSQAAQLLTHFYYTDNADGAQPQQQQQQQPSPSVLQSNGKTQEAASKSSMKTASGRQIKLVPL